MKLLTARHGSLWPGGRPSHDADNNFGHLVNRIFDEATNRQQAAKIQCARFLTENRPPPAYRNAVSQNPPPFPRRPAGQATE